MLDNTYPSGKLQGALSAVAVAGFEAKAANAPQASHDDEPGHYGEAKALEVTNRIVQYV